MMKNAELQKEWANAQVAERRAAAAREREEEQNWSAQESAINRMQGMLHDENAARKAALAKATQDENKRMAREKREREAAWRADQESNNQAETTLTNHHEILEANGTIRKMLPQ